VIIYQEQDEASGALQIGFDSPVSPDREIIIEQFLDLPFTWNT